MLRPPPHDGPPGWRAALPVLLFFSAASGGGLEGVEHGLPPRLIRWTPGVGAVPGLIYGTAWKKDRTGDLVVSAVREGFRAIDTAAHPKHYNESLVGVALGSVLGDTSFKVKREDLWIQTKFTPDACVGQPREFHPYDETAGLAKQVRQSYQSSLQRLGLTYIDSYILHAPYPTHEKTLEAWREMESIHSEAKGAMMLGISNVNLPQLRRLVQDARVKPSFVQNRCLQNTKYDEDVRKFCNENGISYQGFWLLTGNRHVTGDPGLSHVAKATGHSKEQVLYRFFFQHLGVILLSGTKNSDHMQDDLKLDQFSLSALQETELRELEAPRFKETDPVHVTINNRFDKDLRVYWRNPSDGTLVPQGEIAAGGSHHIKSHHSHVFEGQIDGVVRMLWKADREKGAKQSAIADTTVKVTFRNHGSEALEIFWQKDDNQEVSQGSMEPGAGIHVSTHFGSKFVVKNGSGKEVHSWEAHLEIPGTQMVDLGLAGGLSSEL